MSVSLGREARDSLQYLKVDVEPRPFGRAFYALSPVGIVVRLLLPGITTPRAMGYRRTPRFRLYSPIDQTPFQRARLWVPAEVSEAELDRWIEPYKKRGVGNLVPTTPTMYDLRLRQEAYTERRPPSMFTYEFTLSPEMQSHLADVAQTMNSLPYQGVWKVRNVRESGAQVMVVERGVRPTIVFDPKDGSFFGIADEDFDPEQVQQTAAIVLQMLASNTPYIRYTRRRERIPEELLGAIMERAREVYG